MKRWLALATALALTSCTVVPRVAAPAPPPPSPLVSPTPSLPPAPAALSALAAGVTGVDRVPLFDRAGADRALDAFRRSCPALLRRGDASGLTRLGDWAPACQSAGRASDSVAFFRDEFVPVTVGTGAAFATGYYEPEISGSRSAGNGFSVPVYAVPGDLAEQTFLDCPVGAEARTIPPCQRKTRRGRLVDGVLTPYFERSEIDAGALERRAVPIAWAADAVELFFLQVQGSGRLRMADGTVMRIGYAGQNGRDYTAIGRLMRDRGLLAPGQASMQGIMGWLRANPEAGRAIMHENKSYIFFRELTGAGPLGAMGAAVTSQATVAVDPAFVPLGAPVWLDLDRDVGDGIWVAQDTGGAIKGANRFDTFWGAGDEARRIAGGMSARGTAMILLPRLAGARLLANDARAQR